VPGKGKILTQLSLFWFQLLKDVIGNHVITADINQMPQVVQQYRDQLEGRVMLVKRLNILPIEAIVRGYISGTVSPHELAGGGPQLLTPIRERVRGDRDGASAAARLGLERVQEERDGLQHSAAGRPAGERAPAAGHVHAEHQGRGRPARYADWRPDIHWVHPRADTRWGDALLWWTRPGGADENIHPDKGAPYL